MKLIIKFDEFIYDNYKTYLIQKFSNVKSCF